MSDLFSTYKHDFRIIIQQLTDAKTNTITEESLEEIKKTCTAAEHKVNFILIQYKFMELEALGSYELEKDVLNRYNYKIKYEKLKLDEIKKWILLSESKYLEEKAKDDLFSDAKKKESSKILKSNLAIYSQNEKLKSATRNAYECENTAVEIEGFLNNNTETLMRSLNKVDINNYSRPGKFQMSMELRTGYLGR